MRTPVGIIRQTQITYGSTCTHPYCNKPRKPAHKLCSFHNYRLIYRGDPEQNLISPKTINFARKTVRLLAIENSKSNPAWHDLMEALQVRWKAAELYINTELTNFNEGRTVAIRTVRKGQIICADIINNLGFDQTFEIFCAWQYLLEFNPHQFATDISFRHQTIKYLRKQAKSYHSHDLNPRTGKPRAYSPVLYQTERNVVWELMLQIFAATGIKLYQQLEKRAERLRQNKEKIDLAIRNIT